MFPRVSDSELDVDGDLDLPPLGEEDADDEQPVDDGVQLPDVVEDGGDPLDDSYADDVPLDVEIATDTVEPTAVGDDADGIEGTVADHDDVQLDEEVTSMIDEGRGHAEEGLEFGGDDELGLDPIPTELDDGGLEGIEEAEGQLADGDELPPLDGADDDDEGEELDLGIDMGIGPAPEREGEDEAGEGS
jgi:hypothetical protein